MILANSASRYTEIHNIGEIWCATLMDLNRRIGRNLTLQLVVDALKLSRTNPSFLDMRDSIIAALANMRTAGRIPENDYATKLTGVWNVFARFGMGPLAKSNGAYLSGIVADFHAPGQQPGAAPPNWKSWYEGSA
jgi:extracellular elastinolytic metalloproteinase